MIKRTRLRRLISVTRLTSTALLAIVVCSGLAPLPRNSSLVTTKAQDRKPATAPSSRGPREPAPDLSPSTACAPVTKTSFAEDHFSASDWDASVLPGGASAPGYSATQVAAGGNPADFRSVRITASTAGSSFTHLLKGYSFDPATEGRIVSIDGGYDLRNQSRTGTPATFALLLQQNGIYYRGPSDSISANKWTRFSHSGMKATDFVNLSTDGPRNPTFTCDGKPIQIGFVALGGRETNVITDAGLDNWSVNFSATCCDAVARGDRSDASAGPTLGSRVVAAPLAGGKPNTAIATDRKGATGIRVERETITSRCCCDDDAAPVDKNGTIVLPPETDMESPPTFEYVEQDLGEVSALYPGADTTTDTWCQKYPCKPAIGGTVPPEADNPDIDAQLLDQGIQGTDADDVAKQVKAWEQSILVRDMSTPWQWGGPAAPNYTPPPVPHKPTRPNLKYAFGGRDIVFVHGLKLEHVLDRIQGKPDALVNWQQPTTFPASSTNPSFYNGYYKQRAEATWKGTSHVTTGGHIEEFLRSQGYYNRYLVVSYNCSQRLDVAAKAILAQIGDAMTTGKGVVDPTNLTGPPPRDFGTPSFVIVSHSTGGLVTDVALTAAATVPSLNAAYIPKYCKAHIAAHGAHRGSRLATTAIALSGYSAINAPSWLWPVVREIFGAMHPPSSNVPASPYGFQTFAGSILVDLVPSVAQQKWGTYVRDVPVRTLTMVGGHPTFLRPFKLMLLPGYDDGVVNIDSAVANPNNNLLWPSGFRADGAGLVQNFDMGVFGIGPNANVTVSIGGNLFNFSVNILNTSLNSPHRAINYYANQKVDRVSSPGNVTTFPQPHFFASGATPYISPTGMLQTIAAEYGAGSGQYPMSASPLNRNPNIFSYLQSASDHFKGTHDQVMGFNGVLYGFSPLYDTASGEPNFEETRVITDPAVYAPFPMPYGDNEPLLRPQNVPPVIEKIRGLRVTFTVKFFKKKKTRTLWVWKRRYHLLDGWETKRQFDYVYQSVLKN